jgi:hypothetical protein
MQAKGMYLWLSQALTLVTLALGAAGCPEAFVGEDGVCLYNKKFYEAGATFPSSDGCNRCTCEMDGTASCTDTACASSDGGVQCTYGGKAYASGATFPSTDGCNSCGCGPDGEVACTLKACANPPDAGAGVCKYNGKAYAPGESFPSSDGCNSCGCQKDGLVACTLKACANPVDGGGVQCRYDGKVYRPGDTFQSTDGCNGCGCQPDGQVACDLKACVTGQCTYAGKTYQSGASFQATDGCNKCTCAPDGVVSCTDAACGGKTCDYFGKPIKPGTSVPSNDGCNTCSCAMDGSIFCTDKACGPICGATDLVAAPPVDGRPLPDAGSSCIPQGGSCKLGNATFANGEQVICEDGCNTCTCSSGKWASTKIGCPALPLVVDCDKLPPDAPRASAKALYLSNNAIALTANFSGCSPEDSGLQLCYGSGFRESLPVQTDLKLVMTKTATCTAVFNSRFVFDLSPLRDFYRASYQTTSGSIILQADGQGMLYSF